jgi:peroxisomal 2,4-dienoyl-CoA reductase
VTGTPYQAHVSAAKAAVDALSGALAVEEGPRGVRSNVIAPGPVGDTPGMDRLRPTNPGIASHLQGTLPLGRVADVKDIANAAVYLFSDAASYVTGQIIVIDGGNESLRTFALPYPQAVLDPDSVKRFLPKL